MEIGRFCHNTHKQLRYCVASADAFLSRFIFSITNMLMKAKNIVWTDKMWQQLSRIYELRVPIYRYTWVRSGNVRALEFRVELKSVTYARQDQTNFHLLDVLDFVPNVWTSQNWLRPNQMRICYSVAILNKIKQFDNVVHIQKCTLRKRIYKNFYIKANFWYNVTELKV